MKLALLGLVSAVLMAGCATSTVAPEERARIRVIRIVPAENPSRFHFAGRTSSINLFEKMGEEAGAQRKFDASFAMQAPDVAGVLNRQVISRLKAKGYRVLNASDTNAADAVLNLNLRNAGVGLSFDGATFAPQIALLIRLDRSDGGRIYAELLVYGGGMWGTITKIPHDPRLSMTEDEVWSEPATVAEHLLHAAEHLAASVVERL